MKLPIETVDTIVIGGGAAGLSGALLLARSHRHVLVFDEGRPRNERSSGVHVFLGHEGILPADLLAKGREELSHYPNAAYRQARVENVSHEHDGFYIRLKDGTEFRTRALLIATGLIDRLPAVKEIGRFWGVSVHQCPYCDGWESSNQIVGVLGEGNQAAELALEMLLWSERITLFVSGRITDEVLVRRLEKNGVAVEFSLPSAAIGKGSMLTSLQLEDGRKIPCQRLFLVAAQTQHNDFIEKLGCVLVDDSQADCADDGRTNVPGLFVAGNAGKGIQLAMVAAAEGLKAAAAINDWLLDQDYIVRITSETSEAAERSKSPDQH